MCWHLIVRDFPRVCWRLRAMEKPIITTRVTGCSDSIIDGQTGLFADIDPDDLVEKIDMIRKENVIDGRNGRKWVVENFDSRLVWKEIEKLY